MKGLSTPILLLIFNRPDTTSRVFEVVRRIRPTQLFISADGPRADMPDDAMKCNQTRSVVSKIDWPCEVKTLFKECNIGCEAAVGEAITWFFSHVSEGIILEDDCLPDDSFFPFCEELLDKYRNNSSIMFISGSNLAGDWPGDGSYFYSKYSNIWGWATWRRAWKMYDKSISSWKEETARKKIRARIKKYKHWKIRKWTYERIHRGRKNSWAYAWEYALLFSGSLSIVPRHNLVENIGFGKDATNTVRPNRNLMIPRRSIAMPLVHSDKMAPDDRYDNYFFKQVFGGDSVFVRLLKKISSIFRRT